MTDNLFRCILIFVFSSQGQVLCFEDNPYFEGRVRNFEDNDIHAFNFEKFLNASQT